MIQMTLIQIDNYGPWTVTPRPRTESDLQILQAELFADVQRLIAAKKGLVFFTRFDNLLAVTNGLVTQNIEVRGEIVQGGYVMLNTADGGWGLLWKGVSS